MATKQVLKTLSREDALVFVAELANRLTILARGAYRGVENPDVEKLQSANEALHVATAKLIGLARDTERYSNDAFMSAIEERAGDTFGSELSWAIAESLRAVGDRKAKSA